MSDELKQNIRNWINTQGFRLEYRTLQAFKNQGISARMSHYLSDSSGKPREIDVVAYSMCDKPIQDRMLIRVICECKYSTKKPWLLMNSGLQADVHSDWSGLPKSPYLDGMSKFLTGNEFELKDCWHFSLKQPHAHTMVQALGKNNVDQAYGALSKISELAWESVDPSTGPDGFFRLITIPCVVVDGPLFSVSYDAIKDDFSIEPVTFGRLAWAGCRSGTVVDIVHVDALNGYAQTVQATFETLKTACRKLEEFADHANQSEGF